jgi:hypothetical protein
MHTKFGLENLKGRDYSEDLSTHSGSDSGSIKCGEFVD